MRKFLPALALALITTGSAMAEQKAQDPYLWLEDVEGERALQWVREQNAVSQKQAEDNPAFVDLRDDLLAIMDSDDRIAYVNKIGDYVYNFWRDKDNERGLWRRTTLDDYRKTEPAWQTVLDLDALAKAEDENWVWSGATCLRPEYRRCLIALSRGGADATVTREFDLEKRAFVPDGFHRDEAKGGLTWIDADTVYVFTDFGDGSMTTSGYPRIVKQWSRGTPLSEAETVYEGNTDDMYISAFRDLTPGFERDFVSRTLAFYNDEIHVRGKDGKLQRIDVPNSADKSVYREYLTLRLRDPLVAGDTTYAAGSLLAANFDDYMAGKREFQVLFAPDEHSSLQDYGALKDHYYINVLEDVKNRIYVLTPDKGKWQREPLKGAPQFGTVSIGAIDADSSNEYFLTSTDYITPTTLYYGSIGSTPQQLKQLPAQFDADNLEITQHFVKSKDGTRVPYFMVARKDLELNGQNPTLLYGYGGFEISLTPGYNTGAGRGWTSQGGVYVVANIRGGGEYGPRWHQAALQANRHRAYEDFAAVAQDLIDRKVTSAKRLGTQGGSNGGLLMGNMLTLYPQLFGAIVIQVPLLDMKRYHKLLAGASWMAEYGNPDIAEEWEFIKTFSPYQNLNANADYPPVLFTTSTRDDRVHPGHARKMAARMMAQEHEVLYYENIEGGHGGAANNRQAAYMQALAYTFLHDQLFDKAGKEQ